MKFFRNAALSFIANVALITFSCNDVVAPILHGTEYVLMAPAGTDSTDMNHIYMVLATRLNQIELGTNFEMSSEGNKIVVRVREGSAKKPELLRKMLQSWSGLMFRATYTAGEIAYAITEAQQTYVRMHHIDSADQGSAGFAPYLIPVQFPETPLIAYCLPKDTAAVGAILRTDSIAMLFPPDLVFHWGKGEFTPDGKMTVGLFACKTGRNYELGGEHVQQATKQINQQSGSPEVLIQFNASGTDAWANLTRTNTGRCIAVEVGDFVHSYPNVNGEITGGKSVISGNFTDVEVDELVLILNSGTMPVRLWIAEENTF